MYSHAGQQTKRFDQIQIVMRRYRVQTAIIEFAANIQGRWGGALLPPPPNLPVTVRARARTACLTEVTIIV